MISYMCAAYTYMMLEFAERFEYSRHSLKTSLFGTAKSHRDNKTENRKCCLGH